MKTNKAINNSPLQKIGDNLSFGAREAYNLLRANISFMMPDKQGCKIIGTTSAAPQEGKSLTSINFAYSLAKSGKKVLLIDCDLRRPSIAKSLDVPGAPGFSNALSGEELVVHKDMIIEGLDLITAGTIAPNPSELLCSKKMDEYLNEFSDSYDYIVLDFPPVNSVSDVLSLASKVDGYVLIVRHAHTRKRNLLEAIRQLELAKANILGFIYNGYRSAGLGNYYGKNKYYYKSGYGYYSSKTVSETKNDDKKEENKE